MNNNIEDNELQSLTISSRLQTHTPEGNVSNINPPEVHTTRTHNLPLVQQSLSNTTITIEDNSEGDLELSNGSGNAENIMGQYARLLRDHVAEVTRARIGNIIASTGTSGSYRQTTTSLQPRNYSRVRSLPASLGSFNSSLPHEVVRSLSATSNFDGPTRHSHDSDENQIMLIDHGTNTRENSLSAVQSAARIPILMSDRHINSSSHFREDINRFISSSSLINQIGTRNNEQNATASDSTGQEIAHNSRVNASSDNSRDTEEAVISSNELHNAYQDVVINIVRHCLHYIPFVCILFVKFIYDHLVAILDLMSLQLVMYCVNKSLQAQVTRLDQKKNLLLIRDLLLVSALITLRLLAASAPPDPFGLLITPPTSERNIIHQVVLSIPQDKSIETTAKPNTIEQTVVIPKIISLLTIIYYIAVNDLLLKLITISIKLLLTLMPLRTIRHKTRTRLYLFIELLSQFYRSLVPIRQWLLFLFESYSGLHAISGVMFSSTYIVLKGCELTDRGKSLKKSFLNLWKDKTRKPERNLDASDDMCAICQDSYVSPVVLECGHIFCNSCVTTWFKREQTCPMCRAKVGDNLAWHDGATTFFYQLY
ncbi:E3 ubiquitin-protein ligase RNFT1 [Ceratitis capitata]|uniref:RING finger and transmembrane domain-containing protein 2 n=2 Tax=Ceratitis capitata TaxID=7213 RepID=W8BWH9_CERCA|nr:E3 ubiquitin-protein ligase RNFT1 [Ceratitis capitata]